jgi:hypothetical protein
MLQFLIPELLHPHHHLPFFNTSTIIAEPEQVYTRTKGGCIQAVPACDKSGTIFVNNTSHNPQKHQITTSGSSYILEIEILARASGYCF